MVEGTSRGCYEYQTGRPSYAPLVPAFLGQALMPELLSFLFSRADSATAPEASAQAGRAQRCGSLVTAVMNARTRPATGQFRSAGKSEIKPFERMTHVNCMERGHRPPPDDKSTSLLIGQMSVRLAKCEFIGWSAEISAVIEAGRGGEHFTQHLTWTNKPTDLTVDTLTR
ncbi:unnamed protein product [Protopolystoma xenopodis]|uniref:Uncharacterized protein n=1 Tax=Protopolystoma xenopodis TaxID=117903 RepID=A0A3S5BTY1_9PLAT|nr:unnamed protein product [Protopolystoma xenopodis]